MPLVAIAGAGAALAMGGATAIGAVVAGTASLGMVFTAVATVGAVVGAVGAITGDETLSTIGMVMGGIGGIGSLAAGAGLLGEAASVGGFFGSDAAGPIETLTVTPGTHLPGMPAEILDVTRGATQFEPLNVTSMAKGPGMINSLPPDPSGGILDKLPSGGIGGSQEQQQAPPADQSPTQIEKPKVAASTPPTASRPGAEPNEPGVLGETRVIGDNTWEYDGQNWVKQKSFFSSLLEQPGMGMGLLETAGSFISGATDTLKPAQVAYYESQAEKNRLEAKNSQRQLDNMNANIPVARRVSQNVTGMINQPLGAVV